MLLELQMLQYRIYNNPHINTHTTPPTLPQNIGLAHLSTLTSLGQLNLWNCLRITAHGLAHVALLSQLHTVSLRGCQIEDNAIAALAPLRGLARLDLRACERLTGAQLGCLQGHTGLTQLRLKGCYRITESGMRQLQLLRSLNVLELQDCWQITHRALGWLSGTYMCVEGVLMGGCWMTRLVYYVVRVLVLLGAHGCM